MDGVGKFGFCFVIMEDEKRKARGKSNFPKKVGEHKYVDSFERSALINIFYARW